jgi:uncharacterized membrane protein
MLVTVAAALVGGAALPAHAVTPIEGQAVRVSRNGVVLIAYTLTGGYPLAGVWNPDGKLSYLPYPSADVGATAYGINVHGEMSGAVQDANGTAHPVLWSSSGKITDLTGGTLGEAYAINNCGEAVGDAGTTEPLPVRWASNGKVTKLPVPTGTTRGNATAVNDSGVILGNVNVDSVNQPLLWFPSGHTVNLATPTGDRSADASFALNSYGMSVGDAIDQNNAGHPVRWNRTGQVTVLSTSEGQANGINDAGTTVGNVSTGTGFFAVRWSKSGQPTMLSNLPGALGSSAVAINDNGTIVGFAETSTYQDVPVEWAPNGTITELS